MQSDPSHVYPLADRKYVDFPYKQDQSHNLSGETRILARNVKILISEESSSVVKRKKTCNFFSVYTNNHSGRTQEARLDNPKNQFLSPIMT
jgi:hypothetical protein